MSMTEKQKELKRQRDARYRAAKKARQAVPAKPAPKACKKCEDKCAKAKAAEKKAAKAAPAKEPAKKPVEFTKTGANTSLLRIDLRGNANIPEGLQQIFGGFMTEVTTKIAGEFARVLNAFDSALRAHGCTCKGTAKAKKPAKKPAKK